MMATQKEILKLAARLIRTPGVYTKGFWWRKDRAGTSFTEEEIWSPTRERISSLKNKMGAVAPGNFNGCVCGEGAVYAATAILGGDQQEANSIIGTLTPVIEERSKGRFRTMPAFNDDTKTTAEDVAQVLETAAERSDQQ